MAAGSIIETGGDAGFPISRSLADWLLAAAFDQSYGQNVKLGTYQSQSQYILARFIETMVL